MVCSPLRTALGGRGLCAPLADAAVELAEPPVHEAPEAGHVGRRDQAFQPGERGGKAGGRRAIRIETPLVAGEQEGALRVFGLEQAGQ